MRIRRLCLLLAGVTVAATVAVAPAHAAPAAASPALPPGGSYHTLAPTRVLDTRMSGGPVQSATIDLTGKAGLPASGVAAVAINLTVTQPVAAGWAVAYAADQARPAISNIDYASGQTIATMTITALSATQRITVFSLVRAQLIVDVEGYFTTPDAAASGALFNPVTPVRLLDTRTMRQPVGPGHTRTVRVAGSAGIPTSGTTAVVANVTVTAPTAGGFVTAYASGSPRPVSSTINFVRGQTIANRAIVPVGPDGAITLYNLTGNTDVIVDVSGYFTTTGQGSYYVPRAPQRVLDTRGSVGAQYGLICGGCPPRWYPVTEPGIIAAPPMNAVAPTTAVVLTATAVPPSDPISRSAGYVQVYGSAHPTVSDVNFPQSAIVANAVVAVPDPDGNIHLAAPVGAANVVLDLVGFFELAPPVPTPSGLWTYNGGTPLKWPTHLNELRGVTQLSDAASWTDALLADGSVWQFDARTPAAPTKVLDHVLGLASGWAMTYALRDDGSVWAWGTNSAGQLGDGTTQNRMTPAPVPGLAGVVTVGAADATGYAVTGDGTAWAWGWNEHAQFGDGTTTSRLTPVVVPALHGATAVSGNWDETYAIGSGGALYRWGHGATTVLTPAAVVGACAPRQLMSTAVQTETLCDDGTVPGAPGLSDITAIAAASYASGGLHALRSNGTVAMYEGSVGWLQVPGLSGIKVIGSADP